MLFRIYPGQKSKGIQIRQTSRANATNEHNWMQEATSQLTSNSCYMEM